MWRFPITWKETKVHNKNPRALEWYLSHKCHFKFSIHSFMSSRDSLLDHTLFSQPAILFLIPRHLELCANPLLYPHVVNWCTKDNLIRSPSLPYPRTVPLHKLGRKWASVSPCHRALWIILILLYAWVWSTCKILATCLSIVLYSLLHQNQTFRFLYQRWHNSKMAYSFKIQSDSCFFFNRI